MECNELPRSIISKEWGEIYEIVKEKLKEVTVLTSKEVDIVNDICNIWDDACRDILVYKKGK